MYHKIEHTRKVHGFTTRWITSNE